MSIPKTIHYCWLSGEKMPKAIVRCMDSWRKILPDYNLVLWDMNKFDINSLPYVKEACQAKKWAFASDYIRLYALYTEGGIYFDTDVVVKKTFDTLLNNIFFTAVEYHAGYIEKGRHLLNGDGTLKDGVDFFEHGIQIQAAIMGSVKGHPFLKSCLDWYQDKRFILENGTYADKLIAPYIYAHVAVKYGFRYKNELQELEHGITIYPNTIFAGNQTQLGSDTYAIHCCRGDWRGVGTKLGRMITYNNLLRKLFGKKDIEKI